MWCWSLRLASVLAPCMFVDLGFRPRLGAALMLQSPMPCVMESSASLVSLDAEFVRFLWAGALLDAGCLRLRWLRVLACFGVDPDCLSRARCAGFFFFCLVPCLTPFFSGLGFALAGRLGARCRVLGVWCRAPSRRSRLAPHVFDRKCSLAGLTVINGVLQLCFQRRERRRRHSGHDVLVRGVFISVDQPAVQDPDLLMFFFCLAVARQLD